MSPDDRRRAILDAVIPLLIETGEAPSTRQIAEAAGVAEGTIFRAFEDKPTLMRAVAKEVLHPSRGRAEFDLAIGELETLREKVLFTADVLLTQTHRGTQVLFALRRYLMAQPRPEAHGHHQPGPPKFMVEANRDLLEMLTQLFGEHRAELRVPPETAALVLRSLVLGSRHPGMNVAPDLTADQIADTILDGITSTGEDS